jgi:hypothetical protein
MKQTRSMPPILLLLILLSCLVQYGCATKVWQSGSMKTSFLDSTSPEHRVLVHVQDDVGVNIIGAAVRIMGDQENILYVKTTDKGGQAEFIGIPPNHNYVMVVISPGYAPYVAESLHIGQGSDLLATVTMTSLYDKNRLEP